MDKNLEEKVKQWFRDREMDVADPAKQHLKLLEEIGELFEGISKSDEYLVKEALGDIQVVLIGMGLQMDNSERFVMSDVMKN